MTCTPYLTFFYSTLCSRYRELAEKEEGVCFVGRLASYKYFNMDQVRKSVSETVSRATPLARYTASPPTPPLACTTDVVTHVFTYLLTHVNTDQAILNALEIYDNMKETGKLAPKRRPEDFGPGDGPK